MSDPIDWCDLLGWSDIHLRELRISGYIYLKEAKYEIAKTYFEALNVLEPTNAYDARTLGTVYLILGDLNKALETLDRALELEPDHYGAQLNRAKALLFLGRLEEGIAEAQKLTHAPWPEVAQDAEALIMAYLPNDNTLIPHTAPINVSRPPKEIK